MNADSQVFNASATTSQYGETSPIRSKTPATQFHRSIRTLASTAVVMG